jgi:hypothetical protein
VVHKDVAQQYPEGHCSVAFPEDKEERHTPSSKYQGNAIAATTTATTININITYTATDYGLDGRVMIPSRGAKIIFCTASRAALGPTQPRI